MTKENIMSIGIKCPVLGVYDALLLLTVCVPQIGSQKCPDAAIRRVGTVWVGLYKIKKKDMSKEQHYDNVVLVNAQS